MNSNLQSVIQLLGSADENDIELGIMLAQSNSLTHLLMERYAPLFKCIYSIDIHAETEKKFYERIEDLFFYITEIECSDVIFRNRFEQNVFDIICDCRQIEHIGADEQNLDYIPSNISNLQCLKKLCLSGNNITILPEALKYMPNLETIDICGNPIKEGYLNIHKNCYIYCDTEQVAKFGKIWSKKQIKFANLDEIF